MSFAAGATVSSFVIGRICESCNHENHEACSELECLCSNTVCIQVRKNWLEYSEA